MQKSVFADDSFTISTGVYDGTPSDPGPWNSVASLTESPWTQPDASNVNTTASSLSPTNYRLHGKFKEINVPGAPYTPGLGPIAVAISDTGAVLGEYQDANDVWHGFVATPNGVVTTIDAPGAGTGASQGTFPLAINSAGTIVGIDWDSNDVQHGFIRTPDGKITTFNAPGAGTGAGQGTILADIASSGELAGDLVDSNNATHGYLIAPNGAITMVNVPGAGTGAGQGTFIPTGYALNAAGAITGEYIDANGVSHGYVRAPNGKITRFDGPGAGTAAGEGTIGWAINPSGEVVGDFTDANMVAHGYVRAPDGKITTFDAPGAGTAAGEGTTAWAIDPSGVTAGFFEDASMVSHGFVRAPDGKIMTFDAPGAGSAAGEGTVIEALNAAGTIAGYYVDASNVAHAFSATMQFMGHDQLTVGSFISGAVLAPAATPLGDLMASQTADIGMSDLVPGLAAATGQTLQGENSFGLPNAPTGAGFGGLALAGSTDGHSLINMHN